MEAPTLCERCGDRLPARKSGDRKFRRFCSKRCKDGCHKTRTFTCQQCGKTWEAWSKPGQPPRYCSEECRRATAKARANTWYYQNPDRVAVQPSREPVYRSQAFAAWAERTGWDGAAAVARWRQANPDKRRALNAARLARTRGAPGAELFTLDEIYARDGGVCYLCGQDCPREQASMEHVIPTCAPHHGPHTRANVKLAHRSCNARKGRKLLSELSWYQPPT